MLKNFLLLSVFTALCSCKTINYIDNTSSCDNDISNRFHKSTRDDKVNGKMTDENQKNVIVFFENYYNGVVKAYIGNHLIFNKSIISEESLGTTENSLVYDYSKEKNELQNLKIVYGDNCIDIKVIKEYKLIYLYYYDNKWDVVYSNTYPTYE